MLVVEGYEDHGPLTWYSTTRLVADNQRAIN